MFDKNTNATECNGAISTLDSRLIDLLPAAAYICEASSGNIVRYNDRAAQLWGRKPGSGDDGDRFGGSRRLLNPDGTPMPVEDWPMATVLRTGVAVRDRELVVERYDGTCITTLINIEPIRDDSGKIIGAINVFLDITPRKERELYLQKSESHYRKLLQSLPSPAYMCDNEGLITFFNEPAAKLWGRIPKLNDPSDRYCGSFRITEADGTPVDPSNCWMAKALRDKKPYNGCEVIFVRPDGSQVTVIAHITPLQEEDGEVIGAMNVLVDITERKALEFNLHRLLNKLNVERERLMEVFERSPAFMAILSGPDFIIEQANDRCHELLGHRKLIGRALVEAVPELIEQGYPKVLAEVYRTGIPRVSTDTPVRIRNARGEMENFVLDLVYEPLVTNEGVVTNVLIHGIDLTERKQAEHQLAELTLESDRRRRLYETVLSNTPDLIYVFDLNGRFTYANQALLEMWGQSWEEAIGKNCLELGYEPWHAEMHEREIAQVIASGRPVRGEVPFTGTNGTRIYDYIFVPIFSETGEVEAVAGTTRDMTERKQMEEELQRRAEELSISDRKKDEFIAVLAHELRNPLAPVRNGLRIMQLTDDKTVTARTLTMMDRQLSHMVRLVDDLLDVSRLNRNKLYLQKSNISLSEIMNSAVETARPAITSAGQKLILSLPETPVILNADFTRLAQVFSNLLSNSVKYTPRGGEIWFSAQAADGEIVVTVRDSGVGIPASALDSIFDLFSQVSRDNDFNAGGLGIGLALVKTLVEMHGGRVTVASDGPGTGSVFSVALPTTVDNPETLMENRPSSQSAGIKRRRVLVADDNRDACASMATLFQMLGNDVREAYNGLEAVEVAREFQPDIVLMDVGMPKLNGYDATRRIREESGNKVIIVAVTGWGQEEDRTRSRSAGCDGHLVKPVSLQNLESLLKEIELQRESGGQPQGLPIRK